MKYEIKQLNDTDAVIISDEKIKESFYYFIESITTKNMILKASESKTSDNCKKIIATISPFKIEGLPMIELDNKNQEPCNFCGKTVREQMKGCNKITCYRQFLPNQEEDVEKLAKQEFPLLNTENDRTGEIEEENLQLLGHRRTFIKGYKAAQKQYSEEELLQFAKWYANYVENVDDCIEGELYTVIDEPELLTFNEIIERSLQKKQFPIAVELTEDFKPLKWYYDTIY